MHNSKSHNPPHLQVLENVLGCRGNFCCNTTRSPGQLRTKAEWHPPGPHNQFDSWFHVFSKTSTPEAQTESVLDMSPHWASLDWGCHDSNRQRGSWILVILRSFFRRSYHIIRSLQCGSSGEHWTTCSQHMTKWVATGLLGNVGMN